MGFMVLTTWCVSVVGLIKEFLKMCSEHYQAEKNLTSCCTSMSKLAQMVMLLTCIQEVPGSNHSQDINYSAVFLGFPQPLQTKTRPIVEAETLILLPPRLFHKVLKGRSPQETF
jgi:hypothetical protein